MNEFEPPAYLDKAARAEWLRQLDYLKSKGYDRAEYLVPFAIYCQSYSYYQEAIADINAVGLTVPGRNESVVKNPSFTTMREASERITLASKQFGFTPGDLAKLSDRFDDEELPTWAAGL